jgi:myo-inositol-1-phosphate synthase
MPSIKVAVIGVGNCASSLVQVFSITRTTTSQGLIHDVIGDYVPGDVEFVLGIDVDARKVGKDLGEAIFAAPNNTTVFYKDVPTIGAKVMRGRVLDGVADHMTVAGERGFIVAEGEDPSQADIVAALKASGAEILLNFLPVGSQKASEFYMECALEAGVAVVNCIPVFIASNPNGKRASAPPACRSWATTSRPRWAPPSCTARFHAVFGARRDHRAHLSAQHRRQHRLPQHARPPSPVEQEGSDRSRAGHAGPAPGRRKHPDRPVGICSVAKDNKICFLRMEGVQWGNVPVNLELRLSVEDSPNAAACVMDAIRCCKVALERGEGGALIGPSAYFASTRPSSSSTTSRCAWSTPSRCRSAGGRVSMEPLPGCGPPTRRRAGTRLSWRLDWDRACAISASPSR